MSERVGRSVGRSVTRTSVSWFAWLVKHALTRRTEGREVTAAVEFENALKCLKRGGNGIGWANTQRSGTFTRLHNEQKTVIRRHNHFIAARRGRRGICERKNRTIRLCVGEEIETEIMGIIGCRGFKLEPSVEPMVFFCSHFTIGTEFEMDGKTTRVGPTDSQTLQRGRRKDEGGRRELGGRQRIEERDLNFECLKCRDDSGGHSRKIKKVA